MISVTPLATHDQRALDVFDRSLEMDHGRLRQAVTAS